MKKIFAVTLLATLLVSPLYAGTMSELSVIRDNRGEPVIGLVTTGYIDAMVLVANVAQTYTVPTGANYMNFSGNTNFYVKIGGTATVPTATTATGSSSMLNPTLRSVGGVTSVSIIAPSAGIVTIESFK